MKTNREREVKDRAYKYMFEEHKSPLNHIFHTFPLVVENQYHDDIQNAFVKGAEWKDEQFKQYLSQKRDGLKWRSDHIGKNHSVCEELMEQIIKDLGL